MKKIKINLHPHSHKSIKEEKALKLIEKYFPIAFIATAGLIVLNIILFLFTSFSRIPFNNLTKKWNDLGPKAEQMLALREEVTSLRARRQVYKDLMGHRITFSHIFADLFKSLPKNIWLGDIKFSTNQIIFSGYVVEWKEDFSVSINSFIDKLSKENYFPGTFKHINPKGRRTIDFFGNKILQFELECRR